jgi:hypothetical protein
MLGHVVSATSLAVVSCGLSITVPAWLILRLCFTPPLIILWSLIVLLSVTSKQSAIQMY